MKKEKTRTPASKAIKIIAFILGAILLALVVFYAVTKDKPAATPVNAVTPVDVSALGDYPAQAGKFVIGMTIFEPMNYYDETGKLVGFDTEFAQAVCTKLGLEPEFIEINWDNKEVELKSKTIDCIWNGLTVKDELRENMDFSQSYMTNKQVLVVKAENAAQYTSAADFDGKAIVAEQGSAGETAALADATLSKRFTPVAAQTTAIMEVAAGTADAAVVDITMAGATVGAGTSYEDLVILENIQLTDEEYAIGMRKDSLEAVAEIDAAIDELQADGTLDAIAEKYDLTDRIAK